MKNWLWENPSLHLLAWTLLHLLWQGALIAGLLAVGLALLRKRSAQARYLASCAALLLIATAPAITYRALSPSQGESASYTLSAVSSVTPQSSPSALHLITPYLPLLTLLWGVGVAALSLRMLFGWVGVYRLGRVKTQEVPASIQVRVNELSAKLGIVRAVEALASTLAEVPMTFGVARRVILLPVSALAGLSPAMLEAVIAHELAHIRRHDYLVNLVQAVLETLFFYHPAVWWISRQIRSERENACDDMAVNLLGNRMTYARALASMEELRSAPNLALAVNQGDLISRIQRVLGVAPAKQVISPLHALATLSIVMGVFIVLFTASAKPAHGKKATPTLESPDAPSNIVAHQYEVARATPKALPPLPHKTRARLAVANRRLHTVRHTNATEIATTHRMAAESRAAVSNEWQKAIESEMEKPEPPDPDEKDIPNWVKPIMQKAKSDVLKGLKEGRLDKAFSKTAMNAVRSGLKLAQEEMKKAAKERKQVSVEQAKALQEAEREIREAYAKIDK